MKKIIIATIMALFLIGCSSNTPAAGPSGDIPAWFVNTPAEDDEYYYATANANMKSMTNAINRAVQDGQRQLSESIEVQVQSLVKNYTQEAGINETSDVIEFYEAVSKSVSNNTMRGAKILKKEPYPNGNGGYSAYVLMGLSKAAVQGEVVSSIQNEESMYAQFKASQAFSELESNIE